MSTLIRHGSQVVNPLYAIRCMVYLDMGDGLVRDIGFEGTGCAILLESASLMTLAVNGKTVEGARGRPRRPGGAGRCTGLSGPGEVRHAALACAAGGHRGAMRRNAEAKSAGHAEK